MGQGGGIIASPTTTELLGPHNEFERVILPQVLYYAGDVRLAKASPSIAIVGSRDASSDGLARTRALASHVAGVQGVVVSGLAAGVNRAAHEAAIAEGGRAIGVLGTPLDRSYPKANRELQA